MMFSSLKMFQKYLLGHVGLFSLPSFKNFGIHTLSRHRPTPLLKTLCFDFAHQFRFRGDEYKFSAKKGFWVKSHNLYRPLLQKFGRRGGKTTNMCVSVSSFNMLCSTFNMSPKECEKLVKYQLLKSCSDTHLAATVKFLQEKGITAHHIIAAPWILLRKKGELEKTFPLLMLPYLFENVVDGIGFSLFDSRLLLQYNNLFQSEKNDYPHHRNRIYYISYKLNLSIDHFTMKLIRGWKILHIPKYKLDKVIEVLNEFNVQPEDIINDTWIFLHNTDRMRERLSTLREMCGALGKPWICRATDNVFQRISAFTKGYTLDVPYDDLHTLMKEELGMSDSECHHCLPKFLSVRSIKSIFHNIRVLTDHGIDRKIIRYQMCDKRTNMDRHNCTTARGQLSYARCINNMGPSLKEKSLFAESFTTENTGKEANPRVQKRTDFFTIGVYGKKISKVC